jgi:RNA polymerase sigma-70 factor, ECF subfamily
MAIGWGWRARGLAPVHRRRVRWAWGPMRWTAAVIGRNDTTRQAPSETAAFEALVQGRERDIFGYLWRLTGDEQTAYDLCQETFLRAWQYFARIRHYEKPGGWLFRAATNLALNHLQRRTLPARPVTALHEDEAPASDDLAGEVAERDLVHRTLLRLQPRHRAAMVLREVYGMTSEEVARALDITHAAAKMTLSRAREEFRRCYAKEEGDA